MFPKRTSKERLSSAATPLCTSHPGDDADQREGRTVHCSIVRGGCQVPGIAVPVNVQKTGSWEFHRHGRPHFHCACPSPNQRCYTSGEEGPRSRRLCLIRLSPRPICLSFGSICLNSARKTFPASSDGYWQ